MRLRGAAPACMSCLCSLHAIGGYVLVSLKLPRIRTRGYTIVAGLDLFRLFFGHGIVLVHRHNESWENFGRRGECGWTLELWSLRLRTITSFERNIEAYMDRAEFNSVPETPLLETQVRPRSDTEQILAAAQVCFSLSILKS